MNLNRYTPLHPNEPASRPSVRGNLEAEPIRRSSRARRTASPPRIHAFSLIELLVVMAIISMLIGISVPALGILVGSRLNSAGNQVANTIEMARNIALSRGAHTAFMVKTEGTGAYASFCVAELLRNDDGSYGQWTATTPWRTLPEGVFFDSTTGTNSFFAASSSGPVTWPSDFPFRGGIMDPEQEAAIQVYQPDGSPSGQQPLRLRLIDGIQDATTGTVTPKRAQSDGGPQDFYDVLILRDTGTPKVERL